MRRSFKSNVTRYSDELGEYEEEIDLWENVYIDRDFYVQALSDKDDTVLAFAVTTRAKRFRPKLAAPGGSWKEPGWVRRVLGLGGRMIPAFRVKLLTARLMDAGQPERVAASMGAHSFGYWESHWLGNPGNYQHYVFAVNDAGAGGYDSAQVLFPTVATRWDIEWPDVSQTSIENVPRLQAFRRAATPNTYAVLGQTMSPDEYPLTYGPQQHHVRTVP